MNTRRSTLPQTSSSFPPKLFELLPIPGFRHAPRIPQQRNKVDPVRLRWAQVAVWKLELMCYNIPVS